MTLIFGLSVWGVCAAPPCCGAPCPASGAVLRNLLRLLDMIPGYLVGVIAFAAGRKHQRIGDMAARTVVVLDA
jgi:uncharacterized RDD family membrane protein YckC